MMKFSVGQELEGVEFLRVLGSSSHSTAYLIRDTISRRLEYLKLVPMDPNENEETVQRFLREARLHAGLKHPNIAEFYSARRIDGELVMTREWIDGESLAQKLAGGPLDEYHTADYIGQALQALGYAHSEGVVHRNVTSDDLLITENGIVKLTGFDLARGSADQRLTRTDVILGSVHYMAPEQVKGLVHADERSDLYATGVVLYEAIAGRRPFEGESHFDVMVAQVERGVELPSRVNQSVPLALDAVVMRALAKEPDERYQTAAEFREELIQAVRQRSENASSAGMVAETTVSKQAAAPEEPEAGSVESKAAPEEREVASGPLSGSVWTQHSSEVVRMLGIAVIGFSIGLLLFLAGMILLNQ